MSHFDSHKEREDGLRDKLLSKEFALPASAWDDMQGRLDEAALLANDEYVRTALQTHEFALPALAWGSMDDLLDQQNTESVSDSEAQAQAAAALSMRLQAAALSLPASAWADMQQKLDIAQQSAADSALRARLENSVFALPATAWSDMQMRLNAEQQAHVDESLRAQLQTAQFAPPALAWDDMQTRLQLAEAQQQKRRRRFAAFAFSTLAAFCLFSTLWFCLPEGNNNSQQPAPSHDNSHQPIPSQHNAAHYEAPNTVAQTQQPTPSDAHASKASNAIAHQNASLFNPSTYTPSTRSSLRPSHNALRSNKLRLPLLLPPTTSSSTTNSSSIAPSAPQPLAAADDKQNSASDAVETAPHNAAPVYALATLEPQPLPTQGGDENVVLPEDAAPAIALGGDNTALNSPLQINLAVGLSQKLMATSMRSSTTLVLGAGITYAPSAKHKIIVGAQFKQILTDGGVFAPSTTPSILSENPARELTTGSMVVDNGYKANIHRLKRVNMVEMPILYQFQPHRRHGIQAGVKLAAVTHVETRKETPFAQPLSTSQIDKNDIGIEQFSLSATLGYEYKFNRNCALELQYSLGMVNMMYNAQQKYKPYTSFWGQDAQAGNIMLLLADSPTEGATLVEAPERLFNSDLQLSLKYSF